MQWILTILVVTASTTFFMAGCDSNETHQTGNDTPADHADQGHEAHSHDDAAPPNDASAVQPLGVGVKAPTISLRGSDGRSVDLAAKYAQKPTVLIFYRGGWCPYCNTHLGQIATAEPELLRLGYQVLAISPDRPEGLAKTLDKQDLGYELLSDSDVALARAFGLVFHVDDPTVEKYRGFGIDLEQASGRDHHMLPVPAVYIVDRAGVIRFAHWNADYKTRLSPEDLLKAARDVQPTARPRRNKAAEDSPPVPTEKSIRD
jgi:peroxiredoxin